MTKRFSSVLVASSLLASLACSANPSPSSTASRNNPGGTGAGSGGSGTSLNLGGDPGTGPDPTDTRALAPRKKVCDAAGNCSCLRVALLGTLASAALDTDSQAFVTWLNDKSKGSATVTNVATKPTLDATFLAQYDILVVANVNSWTFSADEKAAVEKWVSETGGGIITLTGFASTPAERDASSQLISFSGVNYGTATDTSPSTAPASGQASPVYYKGGTTNLKNCLIYNGNSGGVQHSSPDITTPIPFTPQTGTLAKLTLALNYVGAFIGWPVTAPAGATVVAKDPVSGGNMAVAYEYNGKGRIFAFGDEWVIFSNEWLPNGQPANMQMDQGNPCWVPATGDAAGFFHSVETLYQTKQFWFDAINWVAPPNECNFTVIDTDVVPR